MLQDIPEDDHVKGGRSKVGIKVKFLNISNDHRIAVLSSNLAGLRIDLDAGDSIPTIFKDPADVAGRRADLKDVFVLAGQFYDKSMAAVLFSRSMTGGSYLFDFNSARVTLSPLLSSYEKRSTN